MIHNNNNNNNNNQGVFLELLVAAKNQAVMGQSNYGDKFLYSTVGVQQAATRLAQRMLAIFLKKYSEYKK